MQRPAALIALADLSAAGVRLRHYEAVTLVRELILQVIRGEIPGVPSSHVIRLSASGTITIEGPVDAGGRPVLKAGQLLDSLLPPRESGDRVRIPGALTLVVARALGTLDLPPFATLETFAEALSRFSATNPPAMVRNLVACWADRVERRAQEAATGAPAAPEAPGVQPFAASRAGDTGSAEAVPRPLTISDVRRARRATGVPLEQVARRSRVPLTLLRQLEWGYLFNWPAGSYGRTQVVRYARAAGLDERLVLDVVEPLIEQAHDARPGQIVRAAERPVVNLEDATGRRGPAGRRALDDIVIRPATALPWPQAGEPPVRLRTKVLAALAIPALLAIGLLPAWWSFQVPQRSSPGREARLERQLPGDTGSPADDGSVRLPDSANARPPASAAAAPAEHPPGERNARDTRPVAAPDAAGAASARPGYYLAADVAAFSSSVPAGTAMFHRAGIEGTSAAGGDPIDRGSVLRITRIVDDTGKSLHVRPSPDGSRIAFDSDRAGVWGVYIADADGRNVRRVSPEGFAALPSWSPDGTMLAFVRADAAKPQVWHLWTLDLATGELTQVTRHTAGRPWGGAWFPDGRRIAYNHRDRLVVTDIVSGEERVFPTPRRGRAIGAPAVSPDGQRIAFPVARAGGWMLELTDGSMRKVLDDPAAGEFVWAPEGRRLAYYNGESNAWGIWVMAPR